MTDPGEAPGPAPPPPGEDRGAVWRRGGVALILLIAADLGLCVVWLIAVVQFGWMLATGESNANLTRFGASLAAWIAEVVRFVSCASEDRPFPWAPWPKVD